MQEALDLDWHPMGHGTICLPWPELHVAGTVLWLARNVVPPLTPGQPLAVPAMTRESVQLVNCSLLIQADQDMSESEDLCALSSGGLREQGDPGAPLMVDTVQGWALVGLLSWLDDTKTLSSVAVFTDMRSKMQWLLEILFKTF